MPWIKPDWSVPAHVKAISTTREGGVSQAPYESLNLGTHVEDDLKRVLSNRKHLRECLHLPAEPLWLEQVHSNVVVDADRDDHTFSADELLSANDSLTADGSVSHQTGKVCVVMTADCLPVLMTNQQGTAIGAAHAGWRGLNAGILEATIKKMNVPVERIIIWLGPAIGSENFEVGEEVRDTFIQQHESAKHAFVSGKNEGKWLADIYQLARVRLTAMGVNKENIYGGDYCTYADKRFFSYRRENKTGRMASLIWLDAN